MNVIEQAVAPLKLDAIKRARDDANKLVATMREQLAAGGYDLSVVAPFPSSLLSRAEYIRKQSYRSMFCHIARSVAGYHRPGEPNIVRVDDELVAKFVKDAEQQAAFQYDAFVAKLVAKVGEATAAKLVGNHVWSRSVLHVTKPDGTVQRWHTQQIVNVSKLGRLFNQWPTRLMKGGAL